MVVGLKVEVFPAPPVLIMFPSTKSSALIIHGPQHLLHLRSLELILVILQVEWDMIVVTVFLSIFWTEWKSIWFKIEYTYAHTN